MQRASRPARIRAALFTPSWDPARTCRRRNTPQRTSARTCKPRCTLHGAPARTCRPRCTLHLASARTCWPRCTLHRASARTCRPRCTLHLASARTCRPRCTLHRPLQGLAGHVARCIWPLQGLADHVARCIWPLQGLTGRPSCHQRWRWPARPGGLQDLRWQSGEPRFGDQHHMSACCFKTRSSSRKLAQDPALSPLAPASCTPASVSLSGYRVTFRQGDGVDGHFVCSATLARKGFAMRHLPLAKVAFLAFLLLLLALPAAAAPPGPGAYLPGLLFRSTRLPEMNNLSPRDHLQRLPSESSVS